MKFVVRTIRTMKEKRVCSEFNGNATLPIMGFVITTLPMMTFKLKKKKIINPYKERIKDNY